eukprot:COSAG04_NODE_32329_length_251_cov_1.697368_1_plen_22_part_10
MVVLYMEGEGEFCLTARCASAL